MADFRKLPKGLIVSEYVSGGGDSLIESLHIVSKGLQGKKGSFKTISDLRVHLATDILNNPVRYELKLDKEGRKQLKLMKTDGQLPSLEFLYAFSYYYECQVVVHYGGLKPVIFTTPSLRDQDDLPRVHLQCLAGIHYNPVAELKDFKFIAEELPGLNLRDMTVPESRGETHCDEGFSDDGLEETLSVDVAVGTENKEVATETPWCERHPRTHVASIMVELENHRYCALLDSGSQVSCVALTVFQQQREMVETATCVKIRGLNSESNPVYGMITLTLQVPGHSTFAKAHKFVVVEDRMMPFCVILGADFLASLDVGMDFALLKCKQGSNTLHHFQLTTTSKGSFGLEMDWSSLRKELRIGPSNQPQIAIVVESGTCEDNIKLKSLISENTIVALQKACPIIKRVAQHVNQEGRWPRDIYRFKMFKPDLAVENGTLRYRTEQDQWVPVVPFPMLIEIVLVFHYQLLHVGRQKLVALVRQYVWHPSLAKVAGDVAGSCSHCQKMKVLPVINPPVFRVQTTAPFELVAMDLVALPKNGRYMAALVVVDHHTKWLSAVPLSSKTAGAVTSAFERQILPFLPIKSKRALTDNGPEFSGEVFRQRLASYNIKQVMTTPNRPGSNGYIK